ncbi:MAG: protein-L-isoaspartate(D-aspartate) O-methyltransferase [Methylobacter sp.]|jgi:protein-L-isoaspartate(D-aspartate) O-methyltransferase|uniref:protein-L-isoaspartate(D-aspartate) O-methyltransferase n=1 Tax=Methylobacter sp. TaxID=2051955 RepID=UPI0025F3DA0B|nr:protein-L-isoaspartate(D-aspartate) O-methyltransferase [Methylobacter sp.]MCK9619491.1 protein-L-isoaspartate(D-aspartate) O-methyltransferase [Methylobacter sp.]
MIQSLQGIGMTSLRTRERMIKRLMDQGIRNHKVLAVMRDTPRHIFMDEALSSRAYEDTALPIGYNQTISQPYIVAKMTELLFSSSNRLPKVLEIGTGCGYQTAILAQLVDHVYSVERIAPLQKKAKDRLWDLKLKNVSYVHSDGGWGWLDHAPYDGILVAAAPPEIPEMLLQQMAIGGVMVIPVGKGGSQRLQRVTRTESGYEVEKLEPVVFVPFLSGRK